MPAKSYNELIIQYSNGEGFLHYANEAEGATLDQNLSRKATFEGFESGDLQIFRFLNFFTFILLKTFAVGFTGTTVTPIPLSLI